mmetsp:Transcript_13649/g.40695  ORF Transcript_13649/g.40695 Transcript_13649/m.40695 type:complete len:292 (-) Transcript_13649:1008-1883(-)
MVVVSRVRLQLRALVPLGPVPARVLGEERDHAAQVLHEVLRQELVGVEDERGEQPRADHEAQRHEDAGERASLGAGLGHAAGQQDEDQAAEELRSVVVGDDGVVQVEAAHLLHLEARGLCLADEGPSLRRQAAPRADVGGASVPQLVHDVVADDLRLEDEEQRRHREGLLHDAQHGGLEVELHPDLREQGQGRRQQEDEQQPGEPHAQRLGHDLGRRLRGVVAVLEGAELLAVLHQDEEPHEDEHRHGQRDEVLREVVAHVGVVERERLRQLQDLAEAEGLAREDLLACTG